MIETCKYHEEVVKKSSIKWIVSIFALPAICAMFIAYAFYVNADYRYGSSAQSKENAANIKILDERMINIKADMVRMQADINNNIIDLRTDIRELTKELRVTSRIRNDNN